MNGLLRIYEGLCHTYRRVIEERNETDASQQDAVLEFECTYGPPFGLGLRDSAWWPDESH